MNAERIEARFNPVVKRTSRCTDIDGFNGYGKYRLNSNLPYGYLSRYQKKSGIYFIKNKITEFIYIGSSNNLGSRISKHFSQLKKGNHPNGLLVNDYLKYGIDSFDYGVLELTDDNLLEKEKDYQLAQNQEKLYNLQIRHNKRSKAQIESRHNIDKSTHKTSEYRQKMKAIKQNKIGKFDRNNGNLIEVYENTSDAAVKNNLANSTIMGCCNGSKKSAGGYIWHYLDKDNNILAEGKGKTRTIIKQNEDIV